MLLANQAVAQWLADRDTFALYRNHTARSIAPDREAMYQAMLSAGSAPAIRQQLQNWLNRAEYSPFLIGHFALNLPAYCHFTSPIRRLADLINHRIVKAHLREQPLPYTQAALEQIAQHITQKSIEQEETIAQHYKEQRKSLYQTQIEKTDSLATLSDKEFTRTLKYAIAQAETEPMLNEVKSRLEAGTLTVQDLYLLLIRSEENPLQHSIFQHLQDRIHDGSSILSMAIAQEAEWEGMEYEEQSVGTSFGAWIEIAIEGQVKTTRAAAISPRKQQARQQACVDWIEAYLDNTLVAPEQSIESEVIEPEPEEITPENTPRFDHPLLIEPLDEGKPFASVLNNLCQTLKLEKPSFDFTDVEDGFQCECNLDLEDEWLKGIGISTRKQYAKHLSARRVIEKLQAKAQQESLDYEERAVG